MKDKLIAMAIDPNNIIQELYGPPIMPKKSNPLFITSICIGAIAIIVGVVVYIKKKIKKKKDDENGEDIKK